MTSERIRYEFRDGLAVLTLNRPEKLNAVNKEMIAALGQALDQAEADPAVRAIVLTGAGRAFSAGFDLDMEVATESGEPEGQAVR
ncbi:MAG: enoyl-CoA hydratase/isomerase family protein, partial [Steroidobacterales bacterium]